MQVNEISPSNGDGEAYLEQECEMDSNLMARCDGGNQQMASNFFSYVAERWTTRAAQTKGLVGVVQRWCQREIPAIQDLEALAPCVFAIECTTPHGEQCSSTMCKAVSSLKAECESYLESKDAYALARVAHADAVEKLNVKNQSHQHDAKSSELASKDSELVAEKAKNVFKDAAMVAEKEKGVCREAEAVAVKAELISSRHFGVLCIMQGLRAAGNETSLVTTESQESDADKKRNPNFDALCSLSEVELGNRGFGRASVLDSDDEQYILKIDTTVNAIIGWNVDDNSSTATSTTQFFAPGCVGQELAGVHPILYAIMFKMTQVLGLEQHVIHEQGMEKVDIRKVRSVDFVVSPLAEEYSSSTSPAMLRVPMECKPVARKNVPVGKLLVTARDHILGHMAKKAMIFFDVGGIGEDCTLVGLVLTMGSFVVVVLELTGVGTENVRINTKRTKHAPLFDKETGKNLFGEKASEVAALFEDVNEEHGMPSGCCLLARTLMSVQVGLGTSLMQRSEGCRDTFVVVADNAEPVEAGCYLGSGAHSRLFLMCHQMTGHLEHESQVLQKLGRHGNIPQLHDVDTPISTFRGKIRCERADISCLRLKGIIGQPTSQKRKWSSGFDMMVSDVCATLNSVHSDGWTHIYVRPANIMVKVDSSGNSNKVKLTNWCCARHKSEKEIGSQYDYYQVTVLKFN
ncbi:hypothetical protein MHU86_22994 [Fragilaria crotonensis]|nr:hypothetical protein MHU86_22994 [Fragilaria crotonensis]